MEISSRKFGSKVCPLAARLSVLDAPQQAACQRVSQAQQPAPACLTCGTHCCVRSPLTPNARPPNGANTLSNTLRRGPSSSYDSPNWRRGKAKSLDGSRQRAHHPPSSARLCAAKSFRDRVAEKENAAGGGEHEGRVKPGPSLVQCASFAHAPASPPSHARLFGLAAECLVEQGPIISALLRQCGMGPAPLAGEQVWRHATRRRRCDRSKVFVGREGAATTEDWTHKAARESPVGRQLRGATAQPPGGVDA